MSTPTPVRASASATIPARPETVYDLVTDITRMGEWSPETVSARWLDGASKAAVGARFKGTNVLGSTKWVTTPTISAAVRGQVFAFEVPGKSGGQWRYEFEQVPGGTRVVESVHQDRPSPFIIRLLQRKAGVTDRSEHLRQGIATTLTRLSAAAVAVEGVASVEA